MGLGLHGLCTVHEARPWEVMGTALDENSATVHTESSLGT